MADGNVAQYEQVRSLDDAQNKLFEATALVDLTEWIERAKYLCDHIAVAARIDKKLEESLRDNGVAYLNAQWSTQSSDGLVHLYGIQRILMDKACDDIAKAYRKA